MKIEKRYITKDGKEFTTEYAALEHELRISLMSFMSPVSADECINALGQCPREALAYLNHIEDESTAPWDRVRKVDGKPKGDEK